LRSAPKTSTDPRRSVRNPVSTLNVAFRYHRRGRLDDAEYLYRQVLSENAEEPSALYGLALIASGKGDTQAALEHLDGAILAAPRVARLHNTRGLILDEARRSDEAIASYRRAICIDPQFSDAYVNLAVALMGHGTFDQAAEYARRAISMNPRDALARNTLGYALQTLGCLDEAAEAYRHAVLIDPCYAEAYNHLGVTLNALRRYDEALECYDRAIELDNDYAEARWNRSLVLLLTGRYQEGWADYNYRRHKDIGLVLCGREYPGRCWRGEPLGGKTLMVHYEQGLGDSIQFVRYVPMLQGAGAAVLLEVQESLVGLLRHLPVGSVIGSDCKSLCRNDLHVSLLDLPGLFGTTADNIPATVPYIHADPVKVAYWRNRLLGPRLKVGIVWSGDVRYARNSVRSCRLTDLACLCRIPNVALYSLQKGPSADDLAQQCGSTGVVDLGGELRDLSDTAAVIANLDLLISVDTCVLHLAGAMARPAWGLLCAEPAWQWMLDRPDSPWYPTVRLFRQKQPHDWSDVLEQVRGALAETVSNRTRPTAPVAIHG